MLPFSYFLAKNNCFFSAQEIKTITGLYFLMGSLIFKFGRGKKKEKEWNTRYWVLGEKKINNLKVMCAVDVFMVQV